MAEFDVDVDAMNLVVVRREDPDAVEIVERANHVSVYSWDSSSNSWKKDEVRGCLLVVRRLTEPRYMLYVLNRSSPVNMTEALCPGMLVEAADPGPYLLYRTPDGRTVGMWFLSQSERDYCVARIRGLVAELGGASASTTVSPSVSPNTTGFTPAAVSDARLLEMSPARPLAVFAHQLDTTNTDEESGNGRFLVDLETTPMHPSASCTRASPAVVIPTPYVADTATVTVTRDGLRDAIIRLAHSDAFIDMLMAELQQQQQHVPPSSVASAKDLPFEDDAILGVHSSIIKRLSAAKLGDS